MNVKLAEARRKIITLSARKQTAQRHKQLATSVNSSSVNDTAFGRFDRLCEKIERIEAEAEALLELTGYDGSVVDVADADLETELEEFKKHVTQ
jgi:phage shock protein A